MSGMAGLKNPIGDPQNKVLGANSQTVFTNV